MRDPVKARLLPRDHRALHGVPHAAVDGRHDFKQLGKGGRVHGPVGCIGLAQHHLAHDKGIGAWSDAEIKRAITQGVSRDGTQAQAADGLRRSYARMTEADLNARRRVAAHRAAGE